MLSRRLELGPDHWRDLTDVSESDLRMICELFGLSATGARPYIATVNSPDRGGAYRI